VQIALLTSARTTFCSWLTRSSPKLKRSASSATAIICTSLMSPGATPGAFSDSVTAA
jgi:hypothetical protein